MKEIIFAWPKVVPQSYGDLERLAKVSNFKQCSLEEMDFAEDNFYIIPVATRELSEVNSRHMKRGPGPKRATLAWWNLEKRDSGHFPLMETEGGASNDVDTISQIVDHVLVSDRATWKSDLRMKFLVMGSHPAFVSSPVPNIPYSDYHLCHFSYETPRRKVLLDEIRNNGLLVAPNTYSAERSNYLRSSRAMLNIHQNPGKYLSPLRFALAAAYNLPVISEEMEDCYPLVPDVDYVSVPYTEVARTCSSLLKQTDHPVLSLEPFRKNLRDLLIVRYPFRETIIRTVEELER